MAWIEAPSGRTRRAPVASTTSNGRVSTASSTVCQPVSTWVLVFPSSTVVLVRRHCSSTS
ncbi:MAG: hypothetical protein M5U14_19375 [Acidimicrobiia bacterium]|nr:hypothetical protein [Acidimicrobiia bacterium]